MTPLLEVLGVLSKRTGIEGSLILQFLEMILESRVDIRNGLDLSKGFQVPDVGANISAIGG